MLGIAVVFPRTGGCFVAACGGLPVGWRALPWAYLARADTAGLRSGMWAAAVDPSQGAGRPSKLRHCFGGQGDVGRVR